MGEMRREVMRSTRMAGCGRRTRRILSGSHSLDAGGREQVADLRTDPMTRNSNGPASRLIRYLRELS